MALGSFSVIGSKNTDPHAVFDDLEIRPDDVFAKTQGGVDEVRRQNGSAIPPKLRTVLMLIDGRTPFESFRSTLQTYGDVTQLFSILRDLGLIVKASRSDYVRERNRSGLPQPAAPAIDDAQARFDARARQSVSPLDAITQMPGMMERIAQSEQAGTGYSAPAARSNANSSPSPVPAPAYASPAPPAAPSATDEKRRSELESIKASMIRDVSVVLGADAGPVISKIQGCRSHDDLFASMMGIKKIISIYADRAKAEKFAARYESLSR